MQVFDITKWFWQVGDQSPTTQVYSSQSNTYVPLTDATFVAWLAAGNYVTIISSQAELNQVLIDNNLTPITPSSVITSLAFHNRFTDAEQLAVATAATSNPNVFNFYLLLALAGTVDLANAIVIAGVDALSTAGVITSDRATQILTP
jgi:hypothetical protein